MSWMDDLMAGHRPPGVQLTELGKLLDYDQPGKYLVDTDAYTEDYATSVLTAGQASIPGHTDETKGIYPASVQRRVITFDDVELNYASEAVDIRALNARISPILARHAEPRTQTDAILAGLERDDA